MRTRRRSLDEISPSTGAIGGGTPVSLFGTALRGGSNYSISFGETIVPATYRYAGGYRAGADVLLVRSPPQGAAGVQTVRVTTNGQQYVDAPPFGYYDAPVVSAVSPTPGPRDGGTLPLHGSNFAGGSLPVPLGARRERVAGLGGRRRGAHWYPLFP